MELPALDAALLAAARTELDRVDTVVPHTDADGLASGAIALRTAARDPAPLLLARGATPFGPAAPLPPGRVAVLDWGVRPVARPGLIVDHHAPEDAAGPDQIVVSGHGLEPRAPARCSSRPRREPTAGAPRRRSRSFASTPTS